jgi:hypothetical protein
MAADGGLSAELSVYSPKLIHDTLTDRWEYALFEVRFR